ncbi:flagellar biosynthetic protein FliP [bacterium]|nr:flagellar biosynthetic protein FliP [bacterium]
MDTFNALEGAEVLAAPAYKENHLAFGTAYGLALQAAGSGRMNTNLMPREILRDRIIDQKRPWAVGAVVGLLAAACIAFIGSFLAWRTYADGEFQPAFGAAEAVQSLARTETTAVEEAKQRWLAAAEQQRPLVTLYERRFQALDMLRTVESLLPAFLVSELETAFAIGFRLLLPFLVLDIVVATLVVSTGLVMLPPTLVSLPLKLLVFVMADGWSLVVQALLDSVRAVAT